MPKPDINCLVTMTDKLEKRDANYVSDILYNIIRNVVCDINHRAKFI